MVDEEVFGYGATLHFPSYNSKQRLAGREGELLLCVVQMALTKVPAALNRMPSTRPKLLAVVTHVRSPVAPCA